MAIDVKTQPNQFSFGYSAIPLRVLTDQIGEANLKYLISVNYDESEYVASLPLSVDGFLFTYIEVDSHDFKVGETILFYNPAVVPSYSGYYKVVNVISDTEFVIDLALDAPINPGVASYFYRTIPYRMSPNLNDEAQLDLSNVIKDFVTSNFDGGNELLEAPDTKFEYNVTIGVESSYEFDFTDNIFLTGSKVGFINPSLTPVDVDNSGFRVGDQINIQQEEFEWVYDDNGFYTGNLGFTSATIDHAFEVGQQVTITGQITQPEYNGVTTVIDVPDSKTIVVNKAFTTSTPVEGGSCFGTPVPEYNTVANITQVYHDVTNGMVVETNLDFAKSTPPIAGVIKYADNRVNADYDQQRLIEKNAYNAATTKIQYGFSGNDFDNFVIQNRPANQNNVSTILGNSESYRIEKSTKSWLLIHSDDLGGFECVPKLDFYDKDGVLISEYTIPNPNQWFDFYCPVGIEQIIANTAKVLESGTDIATVKDDVSYYDFHIQRNAADSSNKIRFEINSDCSRYDLYHLCWKDSNGSWISYPFKYINKQITEYERKEYYKKEGRFDLNDDTFGYDTFDRGDKNFYNRSRQKVVLNSGWMFEYENALINDMLGSNDVMIQLPTGEMVSCMVETKKQEFFQKQSDYIWQYRFEVRYSMNEVRF